MSPTTFMVLASLTSPVLGALIGRQHPVVPVPLVLASAVGFASSRGTDWQWAYLVLGLFAAGLAVKRALDAPPPADAVE